MESQGCCLRVRVWDPSGHKEVWVSLWTETNYLDKGGWSNLIPLDSELVQMQYPFNQGLSECRGRPIGCHHQTQSSWSQLTACKALVIVHKKALCGWREWLPIKSAPRLFVKANDTLGISPLFQWEIPTHDKHGWETSASFLLPPESHLISGAASQHFPYGAQDLQHPSENGSAEYFILPFICYYI